MKREILREIWNRIMIEIWSIIPTSLLIIGLQEINTFSFHCLSNSCMEVGDIVKEDVMPIKPTAMLF